MPNKVDDFVPFRLLVFLLDRLGGISAASGYNGDVALTTDVLAFQEATAERVLLVEADASDPGYQGVGADPMVEPSLGYTITGVVKYGSEHPRKKAMALEQDVRTALHEGIADLRNTITRGVGLRFGRCVHDGGYLTPDGEAGFSLLVSFSWSQGKTW